MIRDAFFVIKMLGLTVLVSLVLQAKVGDQTLEEQFHHWIKKSVFVDTVQEAIDGGIAATKAGYKKADTGMKSLLARMSRKREGPKERKLSVDFKRYYEDEEDDDDLFGESPQLPKAATPKAPTANAPLN